MALDVVDLAHDVYRGDGNVAVQLAFARRRNRAEYGSHGIRSGRELAERRVGEERIARADRVDDPLGEGIHHDVGIERLVFGAAAGQHPALAELENERLASRRIVQRRGERTHPGVLVAKSKPRLALVGGDQVEVLELGDVPPAARDLAVGDPEYSLRDRRYELGNSAAVEYPVAEIAENESVALFGPDCRGKALENLVGNRAAVQRIDLEQAVAARDDRVLVGGGSRLIDDLAADHAAAPEAFEDEVLERIVAEDGGERDLRPGRTQMLGDDGCSADVVVSTLVEHAHRRRLCLPSDHRGLGIAVHDRVSDDVHAEPVQPIERRPQGVEGETLAFHEREQLLVLDRRRCEFDELGGGVDDVARREDHFPAVFLQRDDLLLRLGREPARRVFVALGEEIRLQEGDVLDRGGVRIDDDIVDDFEGGEVQRAQFLRHVGTVLPLADVDVGGDAGDKDIGLALRVEQMAQVARVDYVEHAVAHDHFLRARAGADDPLQLLGGLDLVAVFLGEGRQHGQHSAPRCWNQVRVAVAIDSGSQRGALRQYSMAASTFPTPSSKPTVGRQSSSEVMREMSAQVQSGSPGRFGTRIFSPPSSSTSRFTDWGFPAPRL